MKSKPKHNEKNTWHNPYEFPPVETSTESGDISITVICLTEKGLMQRGKAFRQDNQITWYEPFLQEEEYCSSISVKHQLSVHEWTHDPDNLGRGMK